MSENGNTSPRFKILFFKNIRIYLRRIFFALFKSKIAVNRRFYFLFLRLIWDFARDWPQQKMLYLTIRLRARVFYKQIVYEAQPSWLSLVENEGE